MTDPSPLCKPILRKKAGADAIYESRGLQYATFRLPLKHLEKQLGKRTRNGCQHVAKTWPRLPHAAGPLNIGKRRFSLTELLRIILET